MKKLILLAGAAFVLAGCEPRGGTDDTWDTGTGAVTNDMQQPPQTTPPATQPDPQTLPPDQGGTGTGTDPGTGTGTGTGTDPGATENP